MKIWQRENGKSVDFSDPTQGLTVPQQETPSNIYKGLGLILPETRVIDLFLPLMVLVYVYYFSHNYLYKLNPLSLKLLVRKPSFT